MIITIIIIIIIIIISYIYILVCHNFYNTQVCHETTCDKNISKTVPHKIYTKLANSFVIVHYKV